MDARNTFEQPSALAPAPFTGGKIEAGSIRLTLPPKSVVVLTIE